MPRRRHSTPELRGNGDEGEPGAAPAGVLGCLAHAARHWLRPQVLPTEVQNAAGRPERNGLVRFSTLFLRRKNFRENQPDMETNKYSGADRNIQIARHDSFRGSRVSQQDVFFTAGNGSDIPEKHELPPST